MFASSIKRGNRRSHVVGPVHTTPEEFESGALFHRLDLPSTLIRRNCPPKTEEFENGALRFTVDGKHFENGAFENNDVTIIR